MSGILLCLLVAIATPAQATVWWKDRPPPLIYGPKEVAPLPRPRPAEPNRCKADDDQTVQHAVIKCGKEKE